MKKLQSNYKSNYTTSEQSKQLLELGLPANSADCYNVIDSDVYNKDDIRVRQNDYEISYSFFNNKHYNPCWSVGQIIEIMNVCSICGHVSIHRTDREVNQIEQLIEILQNRINDKTIDFSKLELEY